MWHIFFLNKRFNPLNNMSLSFNLTKSLRSIFFYPDFIIHIKKEINLFIKIYSIYLLIESNRVLFFILKSFIIKSFFLFIVFIMIFTTFTRFAFTTRSLSKNFTKSIFIQHPSNLYL